MGNGAQKTENLMFLTIFINKGSNPNYPLAALVGLNWQTTDLVNAIFIFKKSKYWSFVGTPSVTIFTQGPEEPFRAPRRLLFLLERPLQELEEIAR